MLHVPETQSEGRVSLADAWGQCSMLVELCACLHCDVLDLPHVLVAVSICDLSCFGHVSMVLYINILWYVRAPAPSMVPGPATCDLATYIDNQEINQPSSVRSEIADLAGPTACCMVADLSAVRSPVNASSGCVPGRF